MNTAPSKYLTDRKKGPVSVTERRTLAVPFWTQYVLAIIFCVWALQGVGSTEVIDTDAARHAMNGAFIYDLLRTGNLSHPIDYAKQYYGHLPALSMPFHPPMFPAIEAVFYSLFGLHLLTARMLVALAVGLSLILLYRLTLASFGEALLSACICVTTFSLWTVQLVSRDVMLEFPSMVFTLAALYCLRDLDNEYPLSRALPFALFAAIAVWTKQHAVFLGAVPAIHAVWTRQWRRFVQVPFWVSSAILGVAVYGLILLSRPFQNAGVNQISTSSSDVYWILTRTIPSYLRWVGANLMGVSGVFALCAIGAYAWSARRSRRDKPRTVLYLSWMAAVIALLIDLGPVTPRYLFYLFPAAITLGYVWLYFGVRRLTDERKARIVVTAFGAIWLVAGLFAPNDYLRGPAEAAKVVVNGQPNRILYAGEADGNFIFAARTLDPSMNTTVIPLGKLPHASNSAEEIEALCRKYGIKWVILEQAPTVHWWLKLKETLPEFAKLERSIPLESSRARWRSGTIDIYRVPTDGKPVEDLQLEVPKLGGSLRIKL